MSYEPKVHSLAFRALASSLNNYGGKSSIFIEDMYRKLMLDILLNISGSSCSGNYDSFMKQNEKNEVLVSVFLRVYHLILLIFLCLGIVMHLAWPPGRWFALSFGLSQSMRLSGTHQQYLVFFSIVFQNFKLEENKMTARFCSIFSSFVLC